MNDRLQNQLFGSYFGSFLPHSHGYEAANEPKSARKLLAFRFGPYSRTGSQVVPGQSKNQQVSNETARVTA